MITKGMAEATIQGRYRPHLVRVRSAKMPMRMSLMASQILVTHTIRLTRPAAMPTTSV